MSAAKGGRGILQIQTKGGRGGSQMLTTADRVENGQQIFYKNLAYVRPLNLFACANISTDINNKIWVEGGTYSLYII